MGEIALQAPINSIERQMLMQNVQLFYDTLGELHVFAPLSSYSYVRKSNGALTVIFNLGSPSQACLSSPPPVLSLCLQACVNASCVPLYP
jgi:hypothetical protein